jgi:hypothetical protein
MKSKRSLWSTCGVIAALVLLVVACALSVGGVWMIRENPALQQALRQIVSTPTPTSSPTATDTATPVPPTATPSPTITPTATPVTPVVLDAPPTNTPSATLGPTATDTPFPTETPTPAPTQRPVSPTKAAPVAKTNTPAASRLAASAAVTATAVITSTPMVTPTVKMEPFMAIGSRAVLSPAGSGVTGSAVLFSPREFTMIKFNYDGQCAIADVRLGMQGFAKPPVAVLLYLEARPYKDESVSVPIPANVAPNSANALFVYCDSLDKMMAWGPLIPPN